MSSGTGYDNSTDDIASAPASLLDSRTYYYQVKKLYIATITFLHLERINTPTPMYVAGFDG